MSNHPSNPGSVRKINGLDEIPIFFIIGRGRSGSTLLRSLFDAHPHVMIPLESRFVQFLYYKYTSRKKWSIETAMHAIHDLEYGFEPLLLHKEKLMEQIENHASGLSLDRLCKLIYLNTHSEFPKEETQIIGDKNPRYTFFISQLLELFPNAKFIHLVRDYRDNIVAIQRAGNKIRESGNLYFSMGRWKLYNKFIVNFKKRVPEKFLTVRFEDLVDHPETEMKRLCRFLALDFKPEILNYHHIIGNYFNKDGFNALHKSLKTPFDKSKIGEWEHALPQRKTIRCEILAGNFPKEFGYEPKFNVNLCRKIGTILIFYPLSLLGQIRFLLKIFFYRSKPLMRLIYNVLLKIK